MNHNDGANDPTFAAQCPECDCLVACVVVPLSDDDDWQNDELLSDAIKHRAEWKQAGLKVTTVNVSDIRNWPRGKAFRHAKGCSRDKRRSYRKGRPVQAALL